ncbi:MAG: hypothetical protein ACO2PN_19390 [Pyrobaculum sp.]
MAELMERPLPKPGDAAYVEARLLEALVEALEPRVRWTEKLEEDLKKLKALGDDF